MSGERQMTASRGKEVFAALAAVVKGGSETAESDAEKGLWNDDRADVSTSEVVEYGELVEDGFRYRGGLVEVSMVVSFFYTVEALTQEGITLTSLFVATGGFGMMR